jgi:hypothetical protein
VCGVIRAIREVVGMRIWACADELCSGTSAHLSVKFGTFPQLPNGDPSLQLCVSMQSKAYPSLYIREK